MSWFAQVYDPVSSGNINGMKFLPHDRAVIRAMASNFKPPRTSPKITRDPLCTLFVSRLARMVNEDELVACFSIYGPLVDVKMVRDCVTGDFKGYAFVEFERSSDCECAYESRKVLVDYERGRVMKGWVPRRLGGGLGGSIKSGQLRFGGRERPFKVPRPNQLSNHLTFPVIPHSQKYETCWRRK